MVYSVEVVKSACLCTRNLFGAQWKVIVSSLEWSRVNWKACCRSKRFVWTIESLIIVREVALIPSDPPIYRKSRRVGGHSAFRFLLLQFHSAYIYRPRQIILQDNVSRIRFCNRKDTHTFHTIGCFLLTSCINTAPALHFCWNMGLYRQGGVVTRFIRFGRRWHAQKCWL